MIVWGWPALRQLTKIKLRFGSRIADDALYLRQVQWP